MNPKDHPLRCPQHDVIHQYHLVNKARRVASTTPWYNDKWARVA